MFDVLGNSVVLIVVLVVGGAKENNDNLTIDIDYTGLAGEAETQKHDILSFLNKTRIKDQYKFLYDLLLSKLIDPKTQPLPPLRNEGNLTKRSGNFAVTITQEMKSTRRIVSGHNTSIAAVPWQVSVREKTFPICGGSIVTDIWIITAAHCLLRARSTELSVRLGSSWKTHGGEMYDVRESFVHPRYASIAKVNDVGLVRLYTPLRFSSRMLPIRMVARDSKLLANHSGIISGWGKLQEGGPSGAFLQSTTVNTIAMKLCRRSGLDRKAINPASMFCAGSFSQNSPDACQGDSGGPIVSDGVLIGVVSWGLGCARGNFPGVYARLAHPIIWDWVHQHITRRERVGNYTL